MYFAHRAHYLAEGKARETINFIEKTELRDAGYSLPANAHLYVAHLMMGHVAEASSTLKYLRQEILEKGRDSLPESNPLYYSNAIGITDTGRF